MLATPALVVLGFGLLLSVAVVDVGAYLVAAGRAQAAADAAALAAAGGEAQADPVGPGQLAATSARRNDARLDACDCAPGRGRVEVTVSVSVPGVFLPRVAGAQRVQARAAAQLVVPATRPPPGPSGVPPPVPPGR